jgi:amidase
MKITLGFVALAENVSESDAVAVQSLREAGAIVYCKTTMPQTGMVRYLFIYWMETGC